MALTVKDILELPCGQKMSLVAGGGGLNRPVVTVEIADYEFDPDVNYDASVGMDANGFIITSFLFAKNDPSLILKSVKQMQENGMSCVAFKRIIYTELPAEVIAFADKNDFPVFTMENDLWFENIIFDIMYAVQFDDKVYLSEEKERRKHNEYDICDHTGIRNHFNCFLPAFLSGKIQQKSVSAAGGRLRDLCFPVLDARRIQRMLQSGVCHRAEPHAEQIQSVGVGPQ